MRGCYWNLDRAGRDDRRPRDRVCAVRGQAPSQGAWAQGAAAHRALPITLGIPLGIAVELLPTHVPLPAKIRTELLDPVHLDPDPARASDADYVDEVYHDVERRIQAGIDVLATRRRLSIFA
jgi:hypothetical protein